jgi:ubiquinone/menaquinone biosynthesis C-methylase UbiE
MKTTDEQYNKFNRDYSKNRDTYDYICDQDFYEMVNFETKGKNLLDIGCGNGDDLLQFKKLGAQVFGLEPSKEFIEEIKLKNLNVKNGVGENLPFEDKTFDIVISKYAIQTSTQAKECLLEAARVLKKDGILHILVKHPIRQFLEKRKFQNKPVNYFKQEITESIIYNGKITLEEPSHSMEDYFNRDFFSNFNLIDYRENFDFPASEQINGDIYPTYFILTARKK